MATAQELIADLNRWRRAVPASLTEALVVATRQARELRQSVNLRDEDLRLPRLVDEADPASLHTGVESDERPAPGFWNGVARLLGLGGYETHVTTAVDVRKTRQEVQRRIHAEECFVVAQTPILISALRERLVGVSDEIERRTASIRAQRQATLDRTARCALLEGLDRVLCDLDAQRSVHLAAGRTVSAVADLAKATTVITVPGWTRQVLRLAEFVTTTQHLAVRDACLARARSRLRAPGTGPATARDLNIACVSFDEEALVAFLRRFWSDALRSVPTPLTFPLTVTPAGRDGHLSATYISEPAAADGDTAWSDGATADVRVVLLDLEQPGATASQLARSPIPRAVADARPLIVVAQSLAALRESNELAEAAHELCGVLEAFNLAPVAVIANDPCAGLSDLLDRLVLDGNGLVTHDDEHRWARRMAVGDWADDQARAVAVATLRNWREAGYGGPR